MEPEKLPESRKIIFQNIIFRFYVNLRGCTGHLLRKAKFTGVAQPITFIHQPLILPVSWNISVGLKHIILQRTIPHCTTLYFTVICYVLVLHYDYTILCSQDEPLMKILKWLIPSTCCPRKKGILCYLDHSIYPPEV